MAAVSKSTLEDTKHHTLSPKLKHRENAKDTLCRNVTIYGKCRYEDKGSTLPLRSVQEILIKPGCAFNHKVEKLTTGDALNDSLAKKAFNVDSPSFTPSFLAPSDSSKKPGSATISPKAANAAPFLPKTIIQRQTQNATPPVRHNAGTPDWTMEVQEFVPRRLDQSMSSEHAEVTTPNHSYDPFQASHQPNPYLDHPMNGTAYFQNPAYQQPVQYHQYAPIGLYSSNLLPYQRTVHDLFLPNDTREDIQKRMAAALQTLPSSQLPSHIENYHSLVPLDMPQRKSSGVFGEYTSWVYKAQHSLNGNFFVLRRIEGFRLTSEPAIRSTQSWKQISCASVVRVVDAFTNRGFGDSSLFIVTDYHPLAKTLAEHHHLGQTRNVRTKTTTEHISEMVLWSYVTQIASGIKAIHDNKLAARVVDTSKILITGKNRIRLNGCGVLDVILYDDGQKEKDLKLLQRQDLVNFGLVILSIGSNMTMTEASSGFARAFDQFKRFYSADLASAIVWLYSAQRNDQPKTIDDFIKSISTQMLASFDAALHLDDSMHRDLGREVENGRLFRLVAKLNFINERPEFEHDPRWSENGERFFLKLFRDYVFHQVDAQGHPVVDLGHVLTCLNKLDAGTDERITLISRDEQNCFVVSYKELKKAIESAFSDLIKAGRR